MTCEVTRHAWATTWGCHQVAYAYGSHDKAQGQVRQHVPDVTASTHQGLVEL